MVSDDLITALVNVMWPEFEHRVVKLVHVEIASATRWPEWMSIETAARYLDVSVERLWHLKRANAIPYIQDEPNARVFFGRADLDRWMESKRCP